MWGYDHGGGLMGLGMLVLWLLPVALLVWWLVGSASGRRGAGGADSDIASRSPREILDARYARGEIGRDEYLERRTDLERPSPG